MPIVEIKDLPHKMPPKSRLLGIDHGEKTWGLALCAQDLATVTPFKTLRGSNFTENIKQLATICREYEAFCFVIGLPLNMDGSEGPRAQSVRAFARNLLAAKDTLGFEPVIAFQDERLSSHAVEEMLREDLGLKREKIKEVIDAHAAALILGDAVREITRQ